jgi:hypothetical protein
MEELAEPLISVTERLGEIAESRLHHTTLWRTSLVPKTEQPETPNRYRKRPSEHGRQRLPFE